ncbi:MAG: hypothetical protein AB7O45_03640 [Alphaproteobacteria bacterium]
MATIDGGPQAGLPEGADQDDTVRGATDTAVDLDAADDRIWTVSIVKATVDPTLPGVPLAAPDGGRTGIGPGGGNLIRLSGFPRSDCNSDDVDII